MPAQTQTTTRSFSITAADVRVVMRSLAEEVRFLLKSMGVGDLARFEGALVDVNILALNGIVSAAHLQFYLGDELVRAHSYVIAGEPQVAAGPPPDRAPVGRLPAGTQVRLVLTPNPELPREARDPWFKQLGWADARPLRLPEGVAATTYGRFASGGFGIERRLLVNPRYDRPVAHAETLLLQKGGTR